MKLIPNFNPSAQSRVVWLSAEHKEKWSGMIEDIAALVQKLEIESVFLGHRRAAWVTIDLEEVPDYSEKMVRRGLYFLPVR